MENYKIVEAKETLRNVRQVVAIIADWGANSYPAVRIEFTNRLPISMVCGGQSFVLSHNSLGTSEADFQHGNSVMYAVEQMVGRDVLQNLIIRQESGQPIAVIQDNIPAATRA